MFPNLPVLMPVVRVFKYKLKESILVYTNFASPAILKHSIKFPFIHKQPVQT